MPSTSRACRSAPSTPPSSDSKPSSSVADYAEQHELTPELDARFAALAATRVHAAPLRYYVWLPAVRIADMWLRPRAELLPSDPRWWEFDDEVPWLIVSIVFGLVNLAYVGMAAAGMLRAPRAAYSVHRTVYAVFVIAVAVSGDRWKTRNHATLWSVIPLC